MDDNSFLIFCEQQGVVGPMASFFEAFFPGHPLLVELRSSRQRVALRNLWFKSELARVDTAFRAAGLNYAVLKGIPLIERLYPSLSDRPCADIDVLFRFEDLCAVAQILRELGYNPALGSPGDLSRLAKSGEGLEFSLPSGGSIDLHFDLPSPFPFVPVPSFEELARVPIDDLHLFSLLCDHGTKHMWLRISWLLDIALLLASSKTINFQALISHFTQRECSRALRFSLGLLADYEILPEAYLNYSKSGFLRRERSFVLTRHACLTSAPELLPRNLWQHLTLLEGAPRKLSYLIKRLTHLNAEDLSAASKSGSPFSCFAARGVNLINNRVKRFLKPVLRWTSSTITSAN